MTKTKEMQFYPTVILSIFLVNSKYIFLANTFSFEIQNLTQHVHLTS